MRSIPQALGGGYSTIPSKSAEEIQDEHHDPYHPHSMNDEVRQHNPDEEVVEEDDDDDDDEYDPSAVAPTAPPAATTSLN